MNLLQGKKKNGGRKGELGALTIQSIYMVQGEALSTILPILMREEDLSIQQIGIVYSLQPFLFQITRLFLGASQTSLVEGLSIFSTG